jgi:1,4-dihydroxy-2-naphthoate octaprenyltransferase
VNHLSSLWIRRSAWLIAIRPKTLGAAVAPVLIGTSMAISDGLFHLLSCLLCLFAAVLIQIGTNFSNDYYDFFKGADTSERLGPKRVTQSGLLEPDAVKQLFVIVFGMAVLCGFFLVLRGGWAILLIGLLSIASGILYTGGPFPLAYHGLGDIFVLLFFGPIAVSGTYYVQTLQWSELTILAGFIPGLTATALIAVNNLRDAPTDAKVAKRTLAVRFGENFVRREIQFALILSAVIPILLVVNRPSHWPALLSLLALWPILGVIKQVLSGTKGKELNVVLGTTGKILLIQSLLFSVGWIVGPALLD